MMNDQGTNDNIFSDSKLSRLTFDLTFNLCHAFLGIAVTSAFFLILNEVPTFGFVLTSSILFLLSAVAFRLYKRGAFHELRKGDDQ
jgi:ABC-type uncharacterized transport system permease subunit